MATTSQKMMLSPCQLLPRLPSRDLDSRNSRNQVLGPDPWCSHTAAQDGRTRHKDTPGRHRHQLYRLLYTRCRATHHAAPDTLRPIHSPTPTSAHAYGDDSARKLPTLNASPCPGACQQYSNYRDADAPVKRR